MQCQRCGGPMMPETVIKVRRGLFGFHGTRLQGAYCAACGVGTLVDAPSPAGARPAGIAARPEPGAGWASPAFGA
jgi:hypothetical protein